LLSRIAATFKKLFKTLVLVESAISKALRLFYFMKTEIWKDVIGYEGLYQVSNLGNVKVLKRIKYNYKGKHIAKEKILKPGITHGYARVVLTKDGVRYTKKVHRLVASAFLGEQKDLCVNHIDSNRSNNNIENLEWVTILENIRHARMNNRYPKLIMSKEHKKKIIESISKKVICVKTNKIYNSATEAAKKLGFKRSTLIHYLIGSRTNKTTLKYI
jgi:hypothetical protein